MQNPTPKDTVMLMQNMLDAGILSDQMFRNLHHRKRGILRHHKYLLQHSSYKENSRNIQFHNRLSVIYAEYREMCK